MTATITVMRAAGMVLCALGAVFSQTSIPVISQHPRGGVHSENDEFSLSCMTEEVVDLIQWYRDGDVVGSGTEHMIKSFMAQHAGSYTCRATSNGVGTVTSAVAVLQLAVFEATPPGQLNSPFMQPAQLNQSLVLDCGEITSVPPTTYDWEFQNFPIEPSDNAIVGANDGKLYLQLIEANPLNRETSIDTLVCTANNAHTEGSQSGYIQLNLTEGSLSPRVMLAAPQDVTASVGETVFFQCIVGGSPVPTATDIAWTTPTTGTPRLTEKNAILTVRSVVSEDAGMYVCVVDQLGTFTATLTVLVPPVLSVSLTPHLIPTYGDRLSLSCSVTNTAVSEWRWYHNGSPLTSASGAALLIEAADRTHDGLYQCFAYNGAGNDSSTTSVTVMTIPATITTSPSSTLVFEGSNVTYDCTANGAPRPNIIWLLDGLPLPADVITTTTNLETREITSRVELSDVGVAEGGVYVCRAVNVVDGVEVGSVEREATLIVIAPTTITTPTAQQPLYTLELDRPGSLPCVASGQEGTDLQFTWEKDGAPLSYNDRVSLSQDNTSANISFKTVLEGDAGLYVCKVVTFYGEIEGPLVESYTIDVTATPEVLIPPLIRTVSMITATSFKVEWYYPGAHAQIKLNSYTISYRRPNQSAPIAEVTRPIYEVNEYIISASEDTPLKPYTTYIVTVWANYKSGECVGSDNVTVVTSEDVPGAPEEVMGTVINASVVLVEWKHPQDPNGIITNYTLRYKLELSNTLFTTILLPSNATQSELSVLHQATYSIEVAASTSVGMGPYSDSVTVSTKIAGSAQTTPIYRRVWFIMVVAAVGVVVVILLVVVSCGARFGLQRRRSKYTVRSPVEREKLSARSARSLTEDDMADYNARGHRRNGDLGSVVLALDTQETASSMEDKLSYLYEPSISTASRVSSQAPAYINPPSFDEAIKHSRLTPAYSESTLERQPPSFAESDWGMDSNSKTRILRETLDMSPSPVRSYPQSSLSPLHLPTSSPPPDLPPPPPPPPPIPRSPSHSEHKYASLKGLNYRGRGEREGEKPSSLHTISNPIHDTFGYNRLLKRSTTPQHVHVSTMPLQAKTSSHPNFATFV